MFTDNVGFIEKTSLPTGKRHLLIEMLQQKESRLDWLHLGFLYCSSTSPMQMSVLHIPGDILHTWRLGKWDNAGAWHQVGYHHFCYTLTWLNDHTGDNEGLVVLVSHSFAVGQAHSLLLLNCQIYWSLNHGPWEEGTQYLLILLFHHSQMEHRCYLYRSLVSANCCSLMPDRRHHLPVAMIRNWGRVSPTCQGVLLTSIDCGLVIPVTWPFTNFVVHCPWGFFTQTVSPTFNCGNATLARWGHSINSFDANPVWVQQIHGRGRGRHIIPGCDVVPVHGLHNGTVLPCSN